MRISANDALQNDWIYSNTSALAEGINVQVAVHTFKNLQKLVVYIHYIYLLYIFIYVYIDQAKVSRISPIVYGNTNAEQ